MEQIDAMSSVGKTGPKSFLCNQYLVTECGNSRLSWILARLCCKIVTIYFWIAALTRCILRLAAAFFCICWGGFERFGGSFQIFQFVLGLLEVWEFLRCIKPSCKFNRRQILIERCCSFLPLPSFRINWHKEMSTGEKEKLYTDTKTRLKVRFALGFTPEPVGGLVSLGLNTEQLHSVSH